MIYSWGSVLQQLSSGSLCSHFLIADFPKSCTDDATWEVIMRWVCWSVAALEKGHHPTHDPEGKPMKKDSPFFLEKGEPLAKGFRGILWNIQGDHDFFSNALHLPHWASHFPCWECNCQREANPAKLHYKTLDKGKQSFEVVSNEQAKLHPRSGHILFSGVILDLTTKFVRGDCLRAGAFYKFHHALPVLV